MSYAIGYYSILFRNSLISLVLIDLVLQQDYCSSISCHPYPICERTSIIHFISRNDFYISVNPRPKCLSRRRECPWREPILSDLGGFGIDRSHAHCSLAEGFGTETATLGA